MHNLTTMYHWFKHDLERAEHNREHQPWILVFGHRPMYCAKGWWDCSQINSTRTRFGIEVDGELKYGLEELFHKHKVDLAFWGHKHR